VLNCKPRHSITYLFGREDGVVVVVVVVVVGGVGGLHNNLDIVTNITVFIFGNKPNLRMCGFIPP
jgi:hypothetical protein